VSQGTLQVIFEYQTLICQLTGMEIANASLYDGASAAAEAVLMAARIKGQSKVLVAGSLHPQYREVIRTYVKNLGLEVKEIASDDKGQVDTENVGRYLDGETSALVCQSPNFLGVVENLDRLSSLARERQALFVVVVSEAASLGLLQSPGACGADIVAGEGQSLGIPLSFGGPYLGFMSCRKEYLRQFPGRIAGETKDLEAREGLCSLSRRVSSISGGRKPSNICTNQALCALRATIFLEASAGGAARDGLSECPESPCLDRLTAVHGVKRKFGDRFNEFVLEFEGGYRRSRTTCAAGSSRGSPWGRTIPGSRIARCSA
jgi:glycine dehydrogenase subunit 1